MTRPFPTIHEIEHKAVKVGKITKGDSFHWTEHAILCSCGRISSGISHGSAWFNHLAHTFDPNAKIPSSGEWLDKED